MECWHIPKKFSHSYGQKVLKDHLKEGNFTMIMNIDIKNWMKSKLWALTGTLSKNETLMLRKNLRKWKNYM